MPDFQPRNLAGRCSNGFERDRGRLFHAVAVGSWRALCGAQPGRLSAGWQEFKEGNTITCRECLRKIRVIESTPETPEVDVAKLYASSSGDSNVQVVSTVGGKPVTRGQLSAAFDRVRNTKHWKYPVNTIITAELDEIAMIEEAIVFFTGSAPHSTKLENGQWSIRAAGYFAAIGA